MGEAYSYQQLEADAAHLAGDPRIVARIKSQHSGLKFINHLDISQRRISRNAQLEGEYPDLTEPETRLPYKISGPRFFRRVTLPNLPSFLVGPSQLRLSHRHDIQHIRENVDASQHQSFAMIYGGLNIVIQDNPLLTPREDLADFALMHPEEVKIDFAVTSAERTAFTLRHEAQHKTSWETWLDEVNNMTSKNMPSLAQRNEGYAKLWEKTSQATDLQDPYISALSECMSDAAGALGHLSDGGDVRYIQAYADARAKCFYQSSRAYKYPTHVVLDYIAENAEELKKNLRGMPAEGIEKLTAQVVGESALGRDEYYQQVLLLQTFEHARTQEVSIDDIDYKAALGNRKSPLNVLWEAYHAGDSTQWWNRDEKIAPFIKGALAKHSSYIKGRLQEADQCLTSGPAPPKEQKMAELYGTIIHAQDTNPEFYGARGAQELLYRRKIITRTFYEGEALNRELEVHEAVESHVRKMAGKQREIENTAELTMGMMGR